MLLLAKVDRLPLLNYMDLQEPATLSPAKRLHGLYLLSEAQQADELVGASAFAPFLIEVRSYFTWCTYLLQNLQIPQTLHIRPPATADTASRSAFSAARSYRAPH